MKLYIVPTPIGNLEDMTFRGVRTLQEADTILAEDTRKTGILLKHYNISKPMLSYHIFNEHQTVQKIIERLKSNQTLALVSDAGTPAISDPGFLLVREVLKAGFEVECLPGATAFVPALVQSGLPTNSFVFEGFLPHKKGRKTKLEELAQEKRTVILYESPYRLLKLLLQLSDYFGEHRFVSVSRELTKIHEETINGTVAQVYDYFKEKKIKGECVVVIGSDSFAYEKPCVL